MRQRVNGTNFINAQLTQSIFSVWPVNQPLVGEMEMPPPPQKSAKTLFSFRESPVLHTPLSFPLSIIRIFVQITILEVRAM